jgi:hypothetical protein
LGLLNNRAAHSLLKDPRCNQAALKGSFSMKQLMIIGLGIIGMAQGSLQAFSASDAFAAAGGGAALRAQVAQINQDLAAMKEANAALAAAEAEKAAQIAVLQNAIEAMNAQMAQIAEKAQAAPAASADAAAAY